MIEETTQAQTAHSVVEKVVRKLDADKVEREKRRENFVVMNAPESEMESAGQKKADDLKFCYEKLGMSSDEENANDWTKKAEGTKPNQGSGLIGTCVMQTGRQILW